MLAVFKTLDDGRWMNLLRIHVLLRKFYFCHYITTCRLFQLDLVDLDCVREFVRQFNSLDKRLYALINNAGIMMPMRGTEKQLTKDGFEVTMAANYLGTCQNSCILLPYYLPYLYTCIVCRKLL